jgi:large subunit ribosomal protein L3
MKALLGKKIGMSQMFSPQGEVVPVTIIRALPNAVLLKRTAAKDGYEAIQLALPKTLEEKEEREWQARREFEGTLEEEAEFLTVAQFVPGDVVEIVGISKGKGFQGVVKRHHFKGGPASHGHRHVLRRPGSIGSRFPQHVRKGKRMAGRMGGERVTVKNVTVAAVDTEQHLLAIKGAIPGRPGSLVEVRV